MTSNTGEKFFIIIKNIITPAIRDVSIENSGLVFCKITQTETAIKASPMIEKSILSTSI